MKKFFYFGLMLFGMFAFSACSSDSDDDEESDGYGVPSDSEAKPAPEVTSNTVVIPNISAPYVEQGTDGAIGNINMTGIKGLDGDWLNLAGTGTSDQNIWMSIDGKPKAISIVNGNDTRAAQKGMADIVFLVDDSGSMYEEADSIAKQIVQWSKVLDQTVDCRFGCVGYGNNYECVDGGIDMNTVDSLYLFLNDRGNGGYLHGTSRTMGFWGSQAERLSAARSQYQHYGYNECGGVALHFADEQFTFRDGANRIYLNFTDEPNQPQGNPKWSVESVNAASQDYNWNPAKGTIHTIWSESPDTTYFYNERAYYNEKPWRMSQYTGGISLFTDRYFTNFKLDNIEVTAAIVSSYILRFNITDDLKDGLHNIIITIKDNNGNQAVKEFPNVSFSF
jgi:hypothetical protein